MRSLNQIREDERDQIAKHIRDQQSKKKRLVEKNIQRQILEQRKKEKVKRLTPFQEREVSARLEQGLTYEQIATLFGRARGTVNNDFYQIHKTLKIHRTCELASRFAEYRKLYPERIRRFV